jgi:hypothetical protein
MTLAQLIAAIDMRFRSGNQVPVERAVLKAAEWEQIRALLAVPAPNQRNAHGAQ